MLRFPALSIIAVFAVSTSGTDARDTRHVPKPGYECEVSENAALAKATLDAKGVQHEAGWDLRRTLAPSALKIIVTAGITGKTPLGSDDGRATIWWPWPEGSKPGPKEPQRVELTTVPDTTLWSFGTFSGSYQTIGDHALLARWSDLAAFAHRASSLTVVLRNQKGEVLESHPISASQIAQDAKDIETALKKLHEVTSDFPNLPNKCQPVDDIEPDNDIVVT